MISKEEFVRIINKIKESDDFRNDMYKLSNKYGLDGYFDYPDLSVELVKLLNKMLDLPTNDLYGSDIDYFCWELDFGRDYEPGCVKDGDVEVDFSTPEALYDYITKK